MQKTLTDKFIKGLRPHPVSTEYRDAATPGLVLRIGKLGRKVWEVVWTGQGRRKRMRIGEYPNIGLSEVRRIASEKKSAPLPTDQPDRVCDLWERYWEDIKHMRSATDIEGSWRKWTLPLIGHVKLQDFALHHANMLIDHVTKQSSANRAHAVVSYTRPAFRVAASKGWTRGNAFADVITNKTYEKRERVLSASERAVLWEYIQASPYPWKPLLSLLCLTGQRFSEVAGMRRSEIEGNVWSIPIERHKGKRGHAVPLSSKAQRVIAAIPEMHPDYLFSVKNGKPIKQAAHEKKRIDKVTGLEDWRLNDIRRTVATMMGDNGVPRFVITQVLGHAETSVTGIYDRSEYLKEKRDALEMLADKWVLK